MAKTVGELRRVAETLGFQSKEDVQRILEAGGLGGRFEAARFEEYVALLRQTAQKQEQLLLRAAEWQAARQAPACPVCGAAATWTVAPAWICSQGGAQHALWARLRAAAAAQGVTLDLARVQALQVERAAQTAVVRELYWKAVWEELTPEQAEQFRTAYGRYP